MSANIESHLQLLDHDRETRLTHVRLAVYRDPTASADYNPMLRGGGISCKTIFDCTVPFGMKERFERAQFLDVDLKKFLPA